MDELPVLVVDDDEQLRNQVIQIFREIGFHGEGASNVQDAKSRLDESNFKAVIIDSYLPPHKESDSRPRGEGIKVAVHLRFECVKTENRDIPVAFFTGDDDFDPELNENSPLPILGCMFINKRSAVTRWKEKFTQLVNTPTLSASKRKRMNEWYKRSLVPERSYELCYDILSPFLCLGMNLELFFDTTDTKKLKSGFLPTEDGWDYWAELEFQRREVQAHKIPELEALLSQVGELPDNVQAALNNLKAFFNNSTEEESKAGVEKPLQRICEILADYPAGATRRQAILKGYNDGQQSAASFNVLVEELETASQAIREILEFIEESVP